MGGILTPLALWLALVPPGLSAGSTSQIVAGAWGALIVASVVGGAVAFADRAAGRNFVASAYLTTLLLFMVQSIAAHDILWPLTLLVLALVALGAFVVAFSAGRYLRTRSTRSTVVNTARQKPPVAVQAIVWAGLVILGAVVGAFVWLFVLQGP